jgi:hypothetical protein
MFRLISIGRIMETGNGKKRLAGYYQKHEWVEIKKRHPPDHETTLGEVIGKPARC